MGSTKRQNTSASETQKIASRALTEDSTNCFFLKQRTAYEITRYWSSDVCSSDLNTPPLIRWARPRESTIQSWYCWRAGSLGGRFSKRRKPRCRDELQTTSPLTPGISGGWFRSEERRVGEEGRSRWAPCHYKKKDG